MTEKDPRRTTEPSGESAAAVMPLSSLLVADWSVICNEAGEFLVMGSWPHDGDPFEFFHLPYRIINDDGTTATQADWQVATAGSRPGEAP